MTVECDKAVSMINSYPFSIPIFSHIASGFNFSISDRKNGGTSIKTIVNTIVHPGRVTIRKTCNAISLCDATRTFYWIAKICLIAGGEIRQVKIANFSKLNTRDFTLNVQLFLLYFCELLLVYCF